MRSPVLRDFFCVKEVVSGHVTIERWIRLVARTKGFNHGKCEASFEAKASEDSLTGIRSRWGIFDYGKWRLRNCADGDIVARHLTSSCRYSR
jgi:hypothetical protein